MIILKIQGYINKLYLGFEHKNNNIKIVLLEKSVEIAGLNKPLISLLTFFKTEGKFIFNGSLRLQLVDQEIKVYFRKALVGYIDKKDFIIALDNSQITKT